MISNHLATVDAKVIKDQETLQHKSNEKLLSSTPIQSPKPFSDAKDIDSSINREETEQTPNAMDNSAKVEVKVSESTPVVQKKELDKGISQSQGPDEFVNTLMQRYLNGDIMTKNLSSSNDKSQGPVTFATKKNQILMNSSPIDFKQTPMSQKNKRMRILGKTRLVQNKS